MTDAEESNLALVRSYLAALEAGTVGEDLIQFFTPDAVQVELPNLLNPKGGESDLPTILVRSKQGQKLLSTQRYEIRSEIVQGSRVAVEALWTGTLGLALGELAAGSTMRAYFAVFFEFSYGRIRSQRNYDCFEPWQPQPNGTTQVNQSFRHLKAA
ncbi:nuclear transport factor 2 family protein [Leptolyngbya sp. FACHB-261]|uniref:nuclear transport factor 2 family protein n=1 Tax=Leptolyngbya sp. FACHB-261 TaxID=2692806 RepID=UPI0016893DE0|nr:nuclear transport factor 2 family protein [Leptolyngbya sp. FACHB-261]MBD2100401.1 nuclear transport factor 2 family protein [Leptolyngbya sp. FACHB-261]